MSLLDKIKNSNTGLSSFKNEYGYLIYPQLKGLMRNRMIFDNKEVIMWSFNDYLGLSSDEKVIEVEAEAAKEFGVSYPSGSRVLAGNTQYHEKLEEELSKLTQNKCMLLNLGYVGIISIIQSLLDRHDIIIYDQEVHASAIDGISLHKGKRLSFKHNDIDHLVSQFEKSKKFLTNGSEIVLVVDGVYSMSGDVAKLQEIVNLKKTYDFTLVVDDSHGFLVFDEIGFGMMDKIDIYISTFGKALGSLGGFVSADSGFIDYFKYNLRSQIFGRTLAVVNIISVLFKLEMIALDNARRKKLWENTKMLQQGLKQIGVDIGNTTSPITPIFVNDHGLGTNIIYKLREEYNIFCSGVVYPVVPKGTTLLRLIPTALHTKSDIQETLEAFSNLHNSN